jgi:hypothetical protein
MRLLRRHEPRIEIRNEVLENGEATEKGVFPAALRVTAPVFPGSATIATVLAYLVSDEVPSEAVTDVTGVTEAVWGVTAGDLAVIVGLVAGGLIWLMAAYLYRPYTAAHYVSRRNYNGVRERLDHLKIRVQEAENNVSEAPTENGVRGNMRRQALARAKCECREIEKKLKDRGMPWVTGLGYIELWHRVHRAEEALIKVEPCSEVLEGALRDEERLANANMDNRDTLLELLKSARVKLGEVGTETDKSEGSEPTLGIAAGYAQLTPTERMKVLTVLSEVRYEINNFRDNTWEGFVHLRNRLADTVVLLGLATYALLALAVFLEPPHDAITWAVTYFLIGAIAGLFARAQAEWGAETAVDDFGLSKTKLLQIPWLSGLAATGGVLVTSILDPQTNTVSLATVFSDRPALLFVAAVFGVTPNLLIRRLDEQADKTKEDLQSTQSSQSTEDSQSTQGKQRRSTTARRS